MSCPACGGPLAPWRAGLERCPRCGSARTTAPPPEEARGYGPGRGWAKRLAEPVLRVFDRERLRLLRDAATPPAKLLDVGAGRGRFVGVARAAGYAAEGIEPAGAGPGVRRATLGEADVPAGSLDVVTLWHVLEHLEDPAGALAAVAVALRPGGALLVAVPNLDSLQARIGGERWFHLDVPRHRSHLTARGLRALLARSGYAVASERHVLAEHNPFGMWQTLVNRVSPTPSWMFRALQGDARLVSVDLAVHVLALPLLPIAVVLELAAGLARRGGTVVVVARSDA